MDIKSSHDNKRWRVEEEYESNCQILQWMWTVTMNIYWDKVLEKILQLMLPSEAKMLHIFCFKSVHKKKSVHMYMTLR